MLNMLTAGRDARSAGDDTVSRISSIVRTRDLARLEGEWASHLREGGLEPQALKVLQHYQARLVQVEAQAMFAIAHIGTEREDEDGRWWASTAGEGIALFVEAMAPLIQYLPAPKRQ